MRIPLYSTSRLPLLKDDPIQTARQQTREEAEQSRPLPSGQYWSQLLATSLPLAVADVAALGLAGAVAASGHFLTGGALPAEGLQAAVGMAGALLLANLGFGLYPAVGFTPCWELRQTTWAATVTFAGAAAMLHWIMPQARWGPTLAVAWLATLVLLPLFRTAVRAVCARFAWWGQPALILGAGPEGLTLYGAMQARRRQGLRPLGVVDDLASVSRGRSATAVPYLGTLSAAGEIAARQGAYWAVVAMPQRPLGEVRRILEQHAASIPNLLLTHAVPLPMNLWSQGRECGGVVCLHVQQRLQLPGPRLLKRTLDVTLALLVLVVAAPLLVPLALVNWWCSPGPLFYSQERIGLGGRRFAAWKLRTMVVDADRVLCDFLAACPERRQEWEAHHKLQHDPRVTPLGHLLRRTSLDELPQVWNVLRGEMSLVGPRPIVQAEIDKYHEQYGTYLRAVPGISGLWQVSGRNTTTYEDRVNYDVYYVQQWSPWLDLYILTRTIKAVLWGEGAY